MVLINITGTSKTWQWFTTDSWQWAK